jgi:hypothetical protein
MTSKKKAKKWLKRPKSTWIQNIPAVKSIFLGKKKKHIGEAPFMKWNPFTPISTFLVAGIIVNDHFLSLHRNPTILSLPSYKKKKNWKIREINFDTKIDHL